MKAIKTIKFSPAGYLFSFLGILALSGVPAEAATNLWQVFQMANQNNAGIHADQKIKTASFESYFSSFSGLLPQVSAAASVIRNSHSGSGSEADGTYQTQGYSLVASQVLFDANLWMTNVSAYHTAEAAGATYRYQYQQFIQLVIQDYFAVLEAKDLVNVDVANVANFKTAYDQALAQYKVGLEVETAVKQAEARYKQAQATQIQDENHLQSAKQNLQAVINQPVDELFSLRGNLAFAFPTAMGSTPRKNDVKSWVQLGIHNNQNLLAAQQAASASEAAFGSDIGAWLPAVSLQLSVTDNNSHASGNPSVLSALGITHSIDRKVAFVFNWNLFGGSTGANPYSIQEGAAIYAASEDTRLQTYRNTGALVTQDFNNVTADLQNIEQYRAAVVASQSALEQYEARFKVGLSTMLEVLQQVDSLYQSRSQYLQSEYRFINDEVKLKLDSGTLSVKDLEELNHLLV
jgi:outer membrane protein